MTGARFSIYEARDPATHAPGWAGFAEDARTFVAVGWRPTRAEAESALAGAMRRHGLERARSDDGGQLVAR